MRKIILFSTTRHPLYEGYHHSVKEAVESAISKNISLHGIDLSYCDLSHINLDSVFMHNANFQEANLLGANMSEGKFLDCNFSGANMIDACLCYSDIKRCNFRYTQFGATDISMATLDFCDFQGDGLAQLDLCSAYRLCGLAYYSRQKIFRFSRQPTFIRDISGSCLLFESGEICLL